MLCYAISLLTADNYQVIFAINKESMFFSLTSHTWPQSSWLSKIPINCTEILKANT